MGNRREGNNAPEMQPGAASSLTVGENSASLQYAGGD
jgi:hypothetical protein